MPSGSAVKLYRAWSETVETPSRATEKEFWISSPASRTERMTEVSGATVPTRPSRVSLRRKPAKVPQTVSSRPAVSKVAGAHSPPTGAILSLTTSGLRPSGPG